MLNDLVFLQITELIFSFRTVFYERSFKSAAHGVNHPLGFTNMYSGHGRLDYIPQYLCISWFWLRNSVLEASPQVFYWIKVPELARPLHVIKLS